VYDAIVSQGYPLPSEPHYVPSTYSRWRARAWFKIIATLGTQVESYDANIVDGNGGNFSFLGESARRYGVESELITAAEWRGEVRPQVGVYG
jgi:hypothetical protein